MQKIGIGFGLAISLMLHFSCKSDDHKPDPQTEQPHFAHYIAIGNSLTAGYADKGLYRAGQLVAYPNLLAQQLQKVGGGVFQTPLFPEEKANGSGYMILRGMTDGIPVFEEVTTQLAYRSTDPPLLEKYTDVIHNLGVPGMRMDMAFYPGIGSPEGNMYFERLLPEAQALKTYFDYSTNQNHTFFSFSLGNNDLLGYAANGAVTEGPTTLLTSIADFETGLKNYMQALTVGGQQGIIATLPDVTAAPYFTTVTQELLLTNLNKQAGTTFENLFIQTKSGVRTATSDDLIVLEMATNGLLGTDGYGLLPENPIEDQYILDQDEIIEVQERTAAFNTLIRTIAQEKGLALADVHQFLNNVKAGILVDGIPVDATYITGRAFSLDGIHLTPAGNALMANLFILAINSHYQTQVPLVEVKNFLAD